MITDSHSNQCISQLDEYQPPWLMGKTPGLSLVGRDCNMSLRVFNYIGVVANPQKDLR